MFYRRIGTTDMDTSVIALGSWVFGGDCWGQPDDSASADTILSALDAGINIIDTAPIYGNGHSEEIIGKAIKGYRDKLLIATKMGLEKKGKAIRPNLSPSFIREELSNSLRRLGIERIDLYQCHWPDMNTPIEETLSELERLKSEGKIRHIGLSNFTTDLLSRASAITQIASNQVRYAIIERDIEKELLQLCEGRLISVLSYGSLGGGILTGKYTTPPSFARWDVRSFFYKYYKEPLWGKTFSLLTTLNKIALERNVSISEVAINWVLTHKTVASCIVGCRTPQQLRQNASAGNWELTSDELELIETMYKEVFEIKT